MNGQGASAAFIGTGLGISALSDNDLERRRNELHVELSRVNDELQRRGRTRNARLAAERIAATEHMADQCRPLDCSDTGHPDDCYPFP